MDMSFTKNVLCRELSNKEAVPGVTLIYSMHSFRVDSRDRDSRH
jgi:hypothetical protein